MRRPRLRRAVRAPHPGRTRLDREADRALDPLRSRAARTDPRSPQTAPLFPSWCDLRAGPLGGAIYMMMVYDVVLPAGSVPTLAGLLLLVIQIGRAHV